MVQHIQGGLFAQMCVCMGIAIETELDFCRTLISDDRWDPHSTFRLKYTIQLITDTRSRFIRNLLMCV